VIAYCNENLKNLVSYIFDNSEWTVRPSGAKECSLLNNEDNSINGFPSGHIVTTSFILTSIFMYSFYYANTTKDKKSKLLFVILSAVYIMLMMYSRVEKRCHTLIQTIAGLVVGFFLGVVYTKVYKKW
jgi:membrane-associated phospholipid phosphatase